jgi:hypothetical protein
MSVKTQDWLLADLSVSQFCQYLVTDPGSKGLPGRLLNPSLGHAYLGATPEARSES